MDLLHDDDAGWDRAAELLESGRIVALPTDTVYGVAAPIATPGLVARLFPLKARDVSKPVAVLVADVAQAATIVSVRGAAEVLAERFWPGALTIVLPRSDVFDVDLGGAGETVGVRCPDHERLRALCRRLGPLATTSANRSGHPTPATGAEVAVALEGTEVAAVLDAGRLEGSASTVVRYAGGELTVLRAGPIDERVLAPRSRIWPKVPRMAFWKRPDEGADWLSGVALFEGFSSQELKRVADLSTEIEAPAGTVLIDQGDAGVDCFVIVDGTVNVYVGTTHVATSGPGSVVGEMALVDHRPRNASVIAESDVRLLRFDSRHFRQLLAEMPKAEERVMATLTARLRARS